MKYLIYIYCCSVLLISCNPDSKESKNPAIQNCDDLILDPLYNHFYIEDRKLPYTGMCYKLNKKSDTTEIINYNKGKVEGIMTVFFESGNIKSTTSFKKNKYHGEFKEWNEEGELIFHCIYNDGEFDSTLFDNRR